MTRGTFLAAAALALLSVAATPTPTRTRTPSRTPSRTPTPTPVGSVCPVPCDMYQIQFNYLGTWAPDVTGPCPSSGPCPPFGVFKFPCDPKAGGNPVTGISCESSVRGRVGTYQLAYNVHTPLGGWGTPIVQSFQVAAFPPDPLAPWVEALFHDGITVGCGVNLFCPQDAVSREQMAVFLEKVLHGPSFIPPPCTGIFLDVPCATPTPTPAPP
jgi:hypothetical protein